MGGEENEHTAAEVPRTLVLIEVDDVGGGAAETFDVRTKPSHSGKPIRTDPESSLATERYTDDDVSQHRQDSGIAGVGLAEEIGAVPEIPFETDDSGAHPSGADAPDEPAGINRIRQLTSGVAAEVGTPKRCNQAIGSRPRAGPTRAKGAHTQP